MKLLDLYMLLFHTTTLYGINIGFYIAMFVVLLIVIIMNIVCWLIKSKSKN